MANTVRVGAFLYRINPSNDKEMQRCPIGGNSWSRVTEFNGNHTVAQRTSDIPPAPERVLAVFVESYADFRKS